MPDDKEWTKFVTLNPPNEVRFQFSDETRASFTEESRMDNQGLKATGRIEILNKSKFPILFKVKTTNIKNYMVRPNAEVIPSEHSLTVKVVTQSPVNKDSLALTTDRFLVQLTKLDGEPPKDLTPEKIAGLWEKVDKASLI